MTSGSQLQVAKFRAGTTVLEPPCRNLRAGTSGPESPGRNLRTGTRAKTRAKTRMEHLGGPWSTLEHQMSF